MCRVSDICAASDVKHVTRSVDGFDIVIFGALDRVPSERRRRLAVRHAVFRLDGEGRKLLFSRSFGCGSRVRGRRYGLVARPFVLLTVVGIEQIGDEFVEVDVVLTEQAALAVLVAEQRLFQHILQVDDIVEVLQGVCPQTERAQVEREQRYVAVPVGIDVKTDEHVAHSVDEAASLDHQRSVFGVLEIDVESDVEDQSRDVDVQSQIYAADDILDRQARRNDDVARDGEHQVGEADLAAREDFGVIEHFFEHAQIKLERDARVENAVDQTGKYLTSVFFDFLGKVDRAAADRTRWILRAQKRVEIFFYLFFIRAEQLRSAQRKLHVDGSSHRSFDNDGVSARGGSSADNAVEHDLIAVGLFFRDRLGLGIILVCLCVIKLCRMFGHVRKRRERIRRGGIGIRFKLDRRGIDLDDLVCEFARVRLARLPIQIAEERKRKVFVLRHRDADFELEHFENAADHRDRLVSGERARKQRRDRAEARFERYPFRAYAEDYRLGCRQFARSVLGSEARPFDFTRFGRCGRGVVRHRRAAEQPSVVAVSLHDRRVSPRPGRRKLHAVFFVGLFDTRFVAVEEDFEFRVATHVALDGHAVLVRGRLKAAADGGDVKTADHVAEHIVDHAEQIKLERVSGKRYARYLEVGQVDKGFPCLIINAEHYAGVDGVVAVNGQAVRFERERDARILRALAKLEEQLEPEIEHERSGEVPPNVRDLVKTGDVHADTIHDVCDKSADIIAARLHIDGEFRA